LECINQFQVDFEGHIVVVVVLSTRMYVFQGARILVVASVYQAHVLPLVQLGVTAWTLYFYGFFETEPFVVSREYACVASCRLVSYLRSLHHELQRDVVDSLFVHNAFVFKIMMQTYGYAGGEKKKESWGSFLSFLHVGYQ
jgi:hypothetical protein